MINVRPFEPQFLGWGPEICIKYLRESQAHMEVREQLTDGWSKEPFHSRILGHCVFLKFICVSKIKVSEQTLKHWQKVKRQKKWARDIAVL